MDLDKGYSMFNRYVQGILLQIQFLTRIPVPVKIDFDARAFAAGAAFGPVIGLLIGMITAGVFFLFNLMDKRVLSILFAMASGIAASGGLHLDGLADSFDGLFSYRPRERVLEIMKDSRLGTSGAITLVLVLLMKYMMLVSLPETYLVPCLVTMPLLSRMTIAWSAGLMPYARQDRQSAAAGLIDHAGAVQIVIATSIALLLGAIFLKLAVVPLAMIVIAFTLMFNLYLKHRIGGITGDTIGAVVELSEVVFLLSVLALDKLYHLQYMTFIK
jgi:adenosylcobinamide-GDP ribazoletransferase